MISMRWLGCLALLLPYTAHAQSCNVAASALAFPNVDPIAAQSVSAAGSVTVTCNWPTVTLTPNAIVCLNLTAAEPRTLVNGSNVLRYELYVDSANTLPWGATASGTTPIAVTLTKAVGNRASATVNFYGSIAAYQPTVPTVNDSNTVYAQSYSAQTSALVGFYLLNVLPPSCGSLSTSAGSFPFTASATVVNDCSISASNIVFPTTTTLTNGATAQGSLSIVCTNSDAFKVTLSSGASGSQTARAMRNVNGSGGTVGYQLYTDVSRTIVWGDGTAGTAVQTGIGTGMPLRVPVYGAIAPQTAAVPGNYSDTITATIAF